MGDERVHEPKLDGDRLIAIKKGGKVQLFTRNQNNWTQRFKAIAAAMKELPVENVILDGEVVVINENGLPDFQELLNALDGTERKPYCYYVLDLLYLNNTDLRELPLVSRKVKLDSLLKKNKYNDTISQSFF